MKKIVFAALALIVVMASCVKDPQYPGVSISNVTYNPTAVQADDDVTVSATIISFNEFSATLYYSVDEGSFVEVKMTPGAEKDAFTAVMPGQADGAHVAFYVEADGALKAKSATMEYVVGAIAIDYSVLRLNELNGNDKFIEIYNAGAEAINMKGVYIEKDGGQNWVGSNVVTIDAGGYLLLWGEDKVLDHLDIDTANYIFHSGLSAKKNVRIQLFTPAGESIDDFNLTNIDLNAEAYGSVEAPASYSRNADGNWYYADATPEAANVDGVNPVLGLEGGVTPEPPTPEEPDYTNLMLNELSGVDKFIELYNKGNVDLVLTQGMYLEKDDKADPVWVSDGTVTVPAHGYVVLYSEDLLNPDEPQYPESIVFHSGLSAKKTVRIALFMADGTQRDIFTRGSTGEWGQTISEVSNAFARTPDGGDWKLAEPTPGAANPAEGEDIPQE